MRQYDVYLGRYVLATTIGAVFLAVVCLLCTNALIMSGTVRVAVFGMSLAMAVVALLAQALLRFRFDAKAVITSYGGFGATPWYRVASLASRVAVSALVIQLSASSGVVCAPFYVDIGLFATANVLWCVTTLAYLPSEDAMTMSRAPATLWLIICILSFVVELCAFTAIAYAVCATTSATGVSLFWASSASSAVVSTPASDMLLRWPWVLSIGVIGLFHLNMTYDALFGLLSSGRGSWSGVFGASVARTPERAANTAATAAQQQEPRGVRDVDMHNLESSGEVVNAAVMLLLGVFAATFVLMERLPRVLLAAATVLPCVTLACAALIRRGCCGCRGSERYRCDDDDTDGAAARSRGSRGKASSSQESEGREAYMPLIDGENDNSVPRYRSLPATGDKSSAGALRSHSSLPPMMSVWSTCWLAVSAMVLSVVSVALQFEFAELLDSIVVCILAAVLLPLAVVAVMQVVARRHFVAPRRALSVYTHVLVLAGLLTAELLLSGTPGSFLGAAFGVLATLLLAESIFFVGGGAPTAKCNE